MNSPERARTVVEDSLRTMGVDVANLTLEATVLHVLDQAKPSNSVFRLGLRRERLLRKIVKAVAGQKELRPDDREGYECDLLAGGTIDALIQETARLIDSLEGHTVHSA